MKTKFLIFFLFFINNFNLLAQTKLILRPDGASGKDAMVWNGNSYDDYANRNYGDNERLYAHAWTNSGTPDVTRSLLDFDLSHIPAGATIISAKLSLHFYTDLDAFFGEHHGENAGKVSRITSSWDETSVTWNTQPTYTNTNQVAFSKVKGTENLVDLDIKNLVEDIVNDPSNSHGLMFQLATESQYRALAFASSDYHEAAQRPKLEVVYILGATMLSLQPDGTSGKDAMVWNGNSYDDYANRNYGDNERLYAHAWTNSGTPDVSRGLLDFDLSQIPAGATIVSAKLSLHFYTDLDAFFGEHYGENAGKVSRITSSWDEASVTWNSQPAYSTTNQVAFSKIEGTDDLVDLDIKNLVEDMVNDPSNNHGLMFQLATESQYRALAFASSDYHEAAQRPKLEIVYTTGVAELSLQPDGTSGKDAMVWNGNIYDDYANRNYGNNERLYAHAWTNSGIPDVTRSLLDFDLSQIPAGATITSAKLSLHFYTELDAFFGEHHGENAGIISRITSAWDENAVTWNTQPTYSSTNQVSFSKVEGTDDLVDLDIKNLVEDIVNEPSNSHGLMFQLAAEFRYRALAFVSSDHAVPAKRPKLVVTYTQNGEDCPEKLILGDSGASGEYTAQNALEVDAAIEMLDNTTCKAKVVLLKAGFHVMPSSGSVFLAKPEACGTNNIESNNISSLNSIQPLVEAVNVKTNPTLSLSPNPFVEETLLKFNLPESSKVTVQVFSVSGNLITTLIENKGFSSGTYSISFNNQIDYEGMLFFVLQTENGRKVSKGIQQRN